MQRVRLDLSDTTFTRGAVLTARRGYLAFQVNLLVEQRVRHTVLVFLNGEETYVDNLEWTVCDLWRIDERRVAVLGELGEFRVYEGPDMTLERALVPPSGEELSPLRGLTGGSAGQLCATGTLAGAYFMRNGLWQRDAPPIRPEERATLHERSLEHAAFLANGTVVAVGWAGEAWQRAAQGWARLDLPTSVDLFDVLPFPADNTLVACGQLGTIVFGAADALEVLPPQQVTEDLWSIRRFRQRVFCASASLIYELNVAKRELAPLDALDLILPSGSGHLSVAGDEVLWSTGPRELYEWDGQTWQPLLEVP